MKKIIIASLMAIASVAMAAKPPRLALETLFDGSYNSNPDVSIQFSREKTRYYRGFSVDGNAEIRKKVEKLYNTDVKRAETSKDFFNSGSQYSTMTIMNNGEQITIGLSYNGDDGCFLFISGTPEAFK